MVDVAAVFASQMPWLSDM